MKEYFKISFLYVIYLAGSYFIGSLIWAFTIQLALFLAMPPGTLRDVLVMLSLTVVASIFLYIIMYRTGYKGNVSYEKKTLKRLLIPVIASNILFAVIITAMNIFAYNSDEAVIELANVILISTLCLILFPFVMFFGITRGYKKREKDRNKMMSVKQV